MEMTGVDDDEAGFGHGGRATPGDYWGEDSAILPACDPDNIDRGVLARALHPSVTGSKNPALLP